MQFQHKKLEKLQQLGNTVMPISMTGMIYTIRCNGHVDALYCDWRRVFLL